MGRPRKKADEATPQAEETIETTVEEPALADEVAAEEPVILEDEAATAITEPPTEEAPADADLEAPETAVVDEPVAAEAPASEPTSETPPKPRKPKAKKTERKLKPKRAPAASPERKPIVRRPKPEHARGRRKERRGVVVSSAMDKTIVVRVDTVKPDRRYKKVVRRSSKFHAHDEENVAHVGDVVRIVETRPVSKTKHWRLAEVVEQAK
jgi:small subunit ribosomal protein S17